MDCAFEVERIPAELRTGRLWVNYNRNKVPKRPVNPKQNALVNNPATWASFDEAVEAGLRHRLGIGRVLTRTDPIAAIDLDVEQYGRLSPLQERVIQHMASFTEISPSGYGAHVYAVVDKSRIPKGAKVDALGVEIYLDGRYLTVTGRQADFGGREVAERTTALLDVLQMVREAPIPQGSRNNALMRRAGKLRHAGAGALEIATNLAVVNARLCDPPLPDGEVQGVAFRAANYDVSGFLAIPRSVLFSDALKALSLNARALYYDIAAFYTGHNNGRLTAVYTYMQDRGWRSPKVFYAARKELLDAGLLVCTIPAGSHRPARYRIPALDLISPNRDRIYSASESELYSGIYGSEREV